MRLVLANIDYEPLHGSGGHMSDEGMQLQRGLQSAGWALVGAGFDDGCRDVLDLIDRHKPSTVLVQDKRDWDAHNPGGCFNLHIGFQHLESLAAHDDIYKIAVIKDAASMQSYHQAFCEQIRADAVLIYYHPVQVLAAAPWLGRYMRIRTFHSVDSDYCSTLDLTLLRDRAIVTGARNASVYPLREMAFKRAEFLDCAALRHPGYSNSGIHTPQYLKHLARFKVHVATASRFGFALRKIIESVAVGCTPVTDLPTCDKLPMIDNALVRIPTAASLHELRDAIDEAERGWNLEERLQYARLAQEHYDYRTMGYYVNEQVEAFAPC